MSRLSILDLPLNGLKVIERTQIGDNRGFLSRIFCVDELSAVWSSEPINQINHTYTKKSGTVRGMHFQRAPHAETKLVSCLRGRVWDVAVDLRAGSPSFLKWHAEELSAENGRAMLIPKGFAHGFQALSDDAELLYCHSAAYCAEAEDGLNPQDPMLKITWPQQIMELSQRDMNHPLLTTDFAGITL